jgi:hypothetical protein
MERQTTSRKELRDSWHNIGFLEKARRLQFAVQLLGADPAAGHIEQLGRDEDPSLDITAARA